MLLRAERLGTLARELRPSQHYLELDDPSHDEKAVFTVPAYPDFTRSTPSRSPFTRCFIRHRANNPSDLHCACHVFLLLEDGYRDQTMVRLSKETFLAHRLKPSQDTTFRLNQSFITYFVNFTINLHNNQS